MKAISYIHGDSNSRFSECHEVIEADEVVKRVIKNAKYYCETKFGTLAFVSYEENSYSDNKHFYYLINGEKYNSIYTNDYKELVKFHKEDNQPEQLSLF